MRQTDEPRAPKGLVLAAAAAALATGAFTAAGCGGGGGDAPKDPENALLYVKSFNLPNYSGVFLDEDLVIQLSAPADEDTINPDSVQFRTGAAGGTAPYGVFVRGVFMVDPDTATRVVVDPDQISENGIFRAERGKVEVPDSIRIDLGNNEPRTSNGRRQPLFDRTKSSVITFVPEIPTRAALDDTGLAATSTYTVAVPGYPSTNTLENLNGQQLLSPNNRVFTSTFTTVFGTAPQLFLGSEAAGIPRVIHSSPFNGDTLVPVTSPIQISFSHPLDPRTVTPDKFTVEVVSMVPPYVVLPVSVFLAQQRLGQVAVTLTPINPMPADSTIRVTIDSGIEDLVGQAMVESVISFDTGIGGGGLVPPATEEFTATTDMDAALTTANWGNDRPYVGGVAGELTAAFAPYAGDGSDGAFTASVGLTTSLGTGASVQRVYNFTTFSIPIGAKVIAGGRFPLVIHCQGAVDISGELVLDGADGGNGFAGNDSNGLATGGLGGSGAAGGGSGGNGAFAVVGGAGNFDGLDGFGSGAGLGGFTGENDGGSGPFWPRTNYLGNPQTCTGPLSFEPCRQREGGGGASFGTAGTDASNVGATTLARNGASLPNGGKAGATYGDGALTAAVVTSTNATVQVINPANPGGPLRTIVLNGIPTLVQAGSGGGGGGGEDDKNTNTNAWGSADGADEGGGGGGAGGGGVQIVSYTTINVAGIITAIGGDGGGSYEDSSLSQFSQGAGGGGGSGGVIWLQCRGAMTFQPGSSVDASGGAGGQGRADGTDLLYTAGSGGEGRVRIEDSDGNVSNAPAVASTGVFSPSLDLDSVGVSSWQSTGIFTPQYDPPVVVAANFDALSTIKIYLEGAPENLTPPNHVVDDPDVANSTGWIKVYDTSLGGLLGGDPWTILNNNKWYRFKVEFHVDGFHTFTDPLPTVRSLLVDYHE